MSPTDEIIPMLKKLRLSGVLQTLDVRLRQATDDGLAPSEFLLRVLSDETERRSARQLENRLRRAAFDEPKTIEDFDFAFNPAVPKARVMELATCAFIDRHDNVLIVGRTGVGKSHIAQALGHRACRAGHAVLYTGAHEMLTGLRAARADASQERAIARLVAPALLIIDDLGLRELGADEPFDLYEIIRRRHRRASTIITSNRDFEEWAPLFRDPLLAAAAMDRLLEDAHRIVIGDGPSWRNPPADKRRNVAAGGSRA